MRLFRLVAAVAVPVLAATTLSSCGTDKEANASDDQKIEVVSSDDSCDVSAAEAPSGDLVFSVENAGDQVTEFYLYGEDGLRIVGEVENIGPGLSRDLVVRAAPGDYVTSCRPGMTGDGIRADFAVTDSGSDDAVIERADDELDRAGHRPVRRVRARPGPLLVDMTAAFTAAYVTATTTRPRRALPVGARALGAHRDRRRVVRRPRPEDSTCARPTSSPVRSGPAGTASRRTCGRRPRATRS